MNATEKVILTIIATIIVATDAHAGRWLSRDPIQEGAGFVQRDPMPQWNFFQPPDNQSNLPAIGNFQPDSVHLIPIQSLTTESDDADINRLLRQREEPNLYVFVLNDLENRVDPLGLISFSSSCSGDQKAELTAAWSNACQLVNDPKYQCCLNRPGLIQLLKRRCSWGNITFTCNNNQSGICGITMGGTITTCAHAFRSLAIGRGEIVVCYPGVHSCGNVSCTLLHEVGHVLGRPFHTGPVNDNRPDSLANCCDQNIR